MIYFLWAWYFAALWILAADVDSKAEMKAAFIGVILWPFLFPVVCILHVYISEKRKWEISNWYRDNWPPREYEILTGETAS